MTPEDILRLLAACFCEQLAASAGGAPGTCCVLAQEPVVADCCAGFAWVRPVTAFPSDHFPAPGAEPNRCAPPVWGMGVEIGVTRCAPEPCSSVGNSCCDAESDALAVLMSDFNAMQTALLCCLTPRNGDLGKDEVVIGSWTNTSTGGCMISKMTATIRFLNGCSC